MNIQIYEIIINYKYQCIIITNSLLIILELVNHINTLINKFAYFFNIYQYKKNILILIYIKDLTSPSSTSRTLKFYFDFFCSEF